MEVLTTPDSTKHSMSPDSSPQIKKSIGSFRKSMKCRFLQWEISDMLILLGSLGPFLPMMVLILWRILKKCFKTLLFLQESMVVIMSQKSLWEEFLGWLEKRQRELWLLVSLQTKKSILLIWPIIAELMFFMSRIMCMWEGKWFLTLKVKSKKFISINRPLKTFLW